MFPLFASLHLAAHLCEEVEASAAARVEGSGAAAASLPVRDSRRVPDWHGVDDVTEPDSATVHSHRHTRFLAVTGSWSM